jgi:hypothetical protein
VHALMHGVCEILAEACARLPGCEDAASTYRRMGVAIARMVNQFEHQAGRPIIDGPNPIRNDRDARGHRPRRPPRVATIPTGRRETEWVGLFAGLLAGLFGELAAIAPALAADAAPLRAIAADPERFVVNGYAVRERRGPDAYAELAEGLRAEGEQVFDALLRVRTDSDLEQVIGSLVRLVPRVVAHVDYVAALAEADGPDGAARALDALRAKCEAVGPDDASR